MNNTEDQTVKMDGTLNTYKGTLSINILEVLKELSDEQKQDLISDGGWWSFIEKEMAEQIVHEFSRENYNSEYTKLRGMIINSEAMPEVIKQWAISIFESMEAAKEAESYWSDAYWKMYHWMFDQHRNNDSLDWCRTMPTLPKHKYDKPYSKELMKEVEKKVQEWGLLFPEPLTKELNEFDKYMNENFK